jgi:hypothetical protein
MKNLILVLLAIFTCKNTFSQTWQPMGIPEGSGVTELVYWSGGGAVYGDKLWATTGSVNWPTGQRGGVFYSAVSGTYQGIWYRIGGSAGHYIGRTLAVGQDGNLYASLWRDPATFPADGLFKFIPQVGDFGLIYQAQAGDNIFSIAVKNNPHTIFAGTRNGVIRSTDNGTTFGYSNTGIPDSAWVYDIAIDSSGILGITSSKGVFISSDNGDNWLTTTGIPAEDTVTTLSFIADPNSLDKKYAFENGINNLNTGNQSKLYAAAKEELNISYSNAYYLIMTLHNIFDDEELLEEINSFPETNKEFVATRPRQVVNKTLTNSGNLGGVYESTDNGANWDKINDGLPPNPPASSLALKVISKTFAQLYLGLFNDTTNGAGVYKLSITVDVEQINNQIPSEYYLEQNYPNPLNPSTTIQFSIPEQSFVKLEVFNTLGEKIATLVSEELKAGNYKYDWNAERLPSGIYFYTFLAGTFSETKKLVLVK